MNLYMIGNMKNGTMFNIGDKVKLKNHLFDDTNIGIIKKIKKYNNSNINYLYAVLFGERTLFVWHYQLVLVETNQIETVQYEEWDEV